MTKKSIAPYVLASVAILNIIKSPSSFAAVAQLDIDLAHPGNAIPPMFNGLMTEEINHSYDGGLFAELIQNRTFQDPEPGRDGVPIHWSVVGAGKVLTSTADPVNSALPVSLQLELNGGVGGVANDGYWGIPVRPDTKYTASFYAKADGGFSGAVTASLMTDAGDVIVKEVNAGADSLETKINLQGASKIGPTGKAIVIAGEASAVNSIENRTAHPLLFDRKETPKMCFQAVMDTAMQRDLRAVNSFPAK